MSTTKVTAADTTVERLVKPLVQRLLAAQSFEDGAAIILPVMLQLVSQVLKQSSFGDTSAVSRAMIHLRPEGGYRGLVVLEAGAKSISLPYENPSLLPSATAWRWVEQNKSAISVDVVKGTAKPLNASSDQAEKIETKSLAFDSGETVQRLLGRQATHLLVIPMRGNSNTIHGMISIEVDARAAVGEDFFWNDCADALQLISDISTSSLINLPQKKAPEVEAHPLLPVVGKAMANLVAVLKVFAQQDETLLITGASGAGKSRIAEWCHAMSQRGKNELVSIDLQTIPEDMQMAELFGWKRGAFTGAVNDHKGCVAQADGGTLFIDEIDKLSMKAQAGLLHLLETKKYRVLGDGAGGGTREANVRFLVGTNAKLEESVKEGRFREDLYYRINILPVRLPSLKERADEIPQWSEFMAQRKHQEAGLEGEVSVTAETKLMLSRHPWPGNLRQLDNVVRRAYAMALVEQGITDHINIQQQHVERALSMEGQSDECASLVTTLRRAAQSFVDEAQALNDKGATLDLNHAGAFQGFVLSEAMSRLPDRKEVFLLFGKQKAVESRNYHKELKRELFRAEEFLNSLGHQGDSTLHMQIQEFKE